MATHRVQKLLTDITKKQNKTKKHANQQNAK